MRRGTTGDDNTHASSALTQRQQARVALGSEVLPRVGEHVRDALPLRVRQLAPRHRILERRVKAGPVWKSKFYGAFALNLRVDLHAIDTMPARWRGHAGSSQLDRARSAASSPIAPDSLVDFHTGCDSSRGHQSACQQPLNVNLSRSACGLT